MATLTNYNPNESCCDEDRHQAPVPNEFCRPNQVISRTFRPRSVGTGGGCGDGRGPGACPRRDAILMPHEIRTHRLATRTGTRPPHPLNPSPCPYRTEAAFFVITQFGCQHSLGAGVGMRGGDP